MTGEYSFDSESAGFIASIDTAFEGSFFCAEKSFLRVTGGGQTAVPPDLNYALSSSTVIIEGGATILGDTTLDLFSELTLGGASSLTGSLECASGADAFCDDPGVISGTTSGCGKCVKP